MFTSWATINVFLVGKVGKHKLRCQTNSPVFFTYKHLMMKNHYKQVFAFDEIKTISASFRVKNSLRLVWRKGESFENGIKFSASYLAYVTRRVKWSNSTQQLAVQMIMELL